MSKVKIYNNNYVRLNELDWDFRETIKDTLSNIHPYPARFINEIPKNLIEILGCSEGTVILDPFCGSGTTLVEAQRHNFDSIGIDLNPIACLISTVKTEPLACDFAETVDVVARRAVDIYEGDISIPRIPNLDHWFKKDIQKAISAVLYAINEQKDAQTDALRLALSSIIVRVSNQESDTRYAAIDKNNTAEDVFRNFGLAGKKIANAKAEEAKSYSKAKVILQDVLTVSQEQIGNNVGLVITSPPYPNAYEYWLYHKYRMWWLGYDPLEVRSLEIGARPHFQRKNGQTEKDFYEQMDKVFDLMTESLVPGGHICFIVGRSIISGRVIDNGELITKIGTNKGLELVADITREIAATKKSFNLKYGRIKEENILVFRKES